MPKSLVTVRYWIEFTFSVDREEGEDPGGMASEELSKLTPPVVPDSWTSLPNFGFQEDDFDIRDWEDD